MLPYKSADAAVHTRITATEQAQVYAVCCACFHRSSLRVVPVHMSLRIPAHAVAESAHQICRIRSSVRARTAIIIFLLDVLSLICSTLKRNGRDRPFGFVSSITSIFSLIMHEAHGTRSCGHPRFLIRTQDAAEEI